MPTMGRLSFRLPSDPRKGAPLKAKMPPSAATTRSRPPPEAVTHRRRRPPDNWRLQRATRQRATGAGGSEVGYGSVSSDRAIARRRRVDGDGDRGHGGVGGAVVGPVCERIGAEVAGG